MIAKLIVEGEDREHCLERSKRALEHFEVEGVYTTIPFHRLMLDDETFVSGKHTTKYLDQDLDDSDLDEAIEHWGSEPDAVNAGNGAETVALAVEVDGKRFDVVVEEGLSEVPAGGISGGSAGGSPDVAAAGAITAEMQGTILSVEVTEGDEIAQGDLVCVLEAMKMENDVVASASGTVASVPIAEGDSVDMGDTLVALEE
jgi:acetyl-CoA/propionyl-CoA carboxylase biotin carboxyl carrier protein